ncbi:Small-conductance mechanosensitive channel [Shimia gijangensis]|uniref:Small-conductance mechanosensitive channel n=1 Tax=Shimia gijangensis TaxID=1470563 RepID=A0A1M6APB2_9RHOB|nr:mechanosensitive ion channel family protein [Shimia gijangensis]SHI38271.1 Small-conductance mechanosensitive channel [Shimia gijangensis]
MSETSSVTEAVIFFLFLASITLLFVRTAIAVAKGRRHRLRLAMELVALFAIIYFLNSPALRFLGMENLAADFQKGVLFLWTVSLAFLANTALERFVWDGVLSIHGERRIPKLITDGIGLIIYSVAVMFVLHYVYGEPIGPVLATSGAAAIVIGFGAQSTIREVFSGVALNTTKALRIGDYVEIDDVYGQVHDINWRSVSVHNPHTDSLYIFPNSAVAETKILNFSEPQDVFRYYITFSAELSAPPEKVIRVIADELKHSKYVYRTPAPNFNILGYSERGIDYRVRYHFEGDDPWWDAQNEMCMAIWGAARKHGLRIAMNRMLQGSPNSEWEFIDEKNFATAAPDAVLDLLKSHPVFGKLSDEGLKILCDGYETVDLSPPSCFYQKGELADGAFLLLEGRVDILDDEGLHDLEVQNVEPGEFFGLETVFGEQKRLLAARADEYSVAVRFNDETITNILRESENVKKLLSESEASFDNDRRQRRKDELFQIRIAAHHRERHSSLNSIRSGIDEMVNKPALHHLLDHFSKRVRNEELLEGLAATAAHLAVSRGTPDEVERDYFREALRHADLLKHVELTHGLDLFDSYCSQLVDQTDREKSGLVLKELREAKRVKGGEAVVRHFAKGLFGVRGLPDEREQSAFAQIEAVLSETRN